MTEKEYDEYKAIGTAISEVLRFYDICINYYPGQKLYVEFSEKLKAYPDEFNLMSSDLSTGHDGDYVVTTFVTIFEKQSDHS